MQIKFAYKNLILKINWKKKDSIESVLKLLKNSIPMNYKIVDNNIFILPESN